MMPPAARLCSAATVVFVLGLVACTDAGVEQAQHVARQTGERVAVGLGNAKDKVDAVSGDVRSAAKDAGRQINEAAAAEVAVDPDVAATLSRGAEASIACPTPERCTIAAAYADRLRANPAFLSSQARVVPHQRDGRTIGVQLSDVQPLPGHMGFRERDVIVSVNGLRVQSLQSAPQLYLQLRSARRFTVVYERGSERRTCTIDVV